LKSQSSSGGHIEQPEGCRTDRIAARNSRVVALDDQVLGRDYRQRVRSVGLIVRRADGIDAAELIVGVEDNGVVDAGVTVRVGLVDSRDQARNVARVDVENRWYDAIFETIQSWLDYPPAPCVLLLGSSAEYVGGVS
jgi:hypothetical protein